VSEGPPRTPSAPRRQIGELRVTSGPNQGRMFALGESTTLGREETAEIVLEDSSGELSRRHAHIGLLDGVATIEDLGSTNGTLLNGERISGPQPLRSGDQITIGKYVLQFASALAEPPPPAQPTSDPQLTRVRAAQPPPAQPTPDPQLTRVRAAQPPSERPPTFAPAGSEGELRILSGPGAGKAAALVGNSATIGREPECDLQVLDSEVSRLHAKVTVRDGVAAIDDLHSSNGTYVNGERILAHTVLAPGDRIQIGEATIELTSPVFAGAAARTLPPQVSGVRDVISQSSKLLTAESGTRKWWTLAVVLITVFMLLLDVTIVAVALPTISAALHPSFSQLQWIVDGYALMLTSVLLTAGMMADIFGRKRILTFGLVLFTIASVLCAQAPNATVLDFARGLQGIGGATMFACALALIVQEFPAGERAVAFGLYGAVSGLSVALGPIVGGVLVQGVGWQAIFYINVPIAIAAFAILRRKVVNLPGPKTQIDWPGLFTFSGAMFLAIFATIRGNDEGWTSTLILGCFAASVLLFVAFVAIERRRKFPMFDLGLFGNPTFVGSSVAAFAVCFSVLALIFFLTTWMQSILGYSAVGTGLRMLVFTGAALMFAPLAGRMSGTVSPRIVLPLGLLLVAGGVLSMTAVSSSSSWTAILPGLILTGIGLGLMNPTLASTAVSVVPPWRGGMASGMNSTFREAGTAAGIAVAGTLLQHQVRISVHNAFAGSPLASLAKTAANAIAAGGTPQLVHRSPVSFRPGIVSVAHMSYASGLRTIFVLAAVVAAVGCIIGLALIRKRHMIYAGEGGH
jgi:EmrB/QacA subfamily drug resistance transporter